MAGEDVPDIVTVEEVQEITFALIGEGEPLP